MNILLVTNISNKDLFKTSRLELAKALRKRGHKVTTIMKKDIGERISAKKNLIYLPTIIQPILSGLLLGIILLFYTPIIARRKKIDIVIAVGASIWFPFALMLKPFNIPVVMDVRGFPIDRGKSISFDVFLHLSKNILVGYTTITPELKEILNKNYGIENKKIGCWSSGVSMKKFNNTPYPLKKINKLEFGKSFILMYHGSYSQTRGIENLFKSLGELKNDLRKKIKLIIIGMDSETSKYLLLLCEKNEIKDMAIFIPKIKYDLMPSYISICDVGIIPLPPENKWWQVSSPLKTLEYMAMEKPIIVTNIPAHQRIFAKGECGVLLDTNSPKALAEAITYLYTNRNKLDSMGKIGREIVEKYYTWESKALDVEKFLKNILGE